ncbi:MAG: endolytic transglycosylase MltG [Chitinophagales bacterium]|nr:endolytic transglycosylase MltG [Chitinophagales bacterium]MDW8428182.1 endolytic transglycosylase MltG [Chitinophagales bacterium]
MVRRRKQRGAFQRGKRVALVLLVLALFSAGAMAYRFYQIVYAPSVHVDEEDFLYIPTGTNYTELLALLQQQNVVRKIEHFDWTARQMNLPNHVQPGRYRIRNGMTNRELVAMLRSGRQEPVRLVLNKFRSAQELVRYVSNRLEADQTTLLLLFQDSVFLRSYGLKPATSLAIIIPNTYEFFWNTSARDFFDRMYREYERFWTPQRRQQAQQLGLTPVEVVVLASIVEEETNHQPEKPIIASVYLNRLQRGMKLQADPTVKFAVGDFGLRRVLLHHLQTPSPYNTYLVSGLPPGPICTPQPATIDAVLQATPTNYLYFCANPEQPGTHVFAHTLAQHKRNARRYQQWLSQQGIYR